MELPAGVDLQNDDELIRVARRVANIAVEDGSAEFNGVRWAAEILEKQDASLLTISYGAVALALYRTLQLAEARLLGRRARVNDEEECNCPTQGLPAPSTPCKRFYVMPGMKATIPSRSRSLSKRTCHKMTLNWSSSRPWALDTRMTSARGSANWGVNFRRYRLASRLSSCVRPARLPGGEPRSELDRELSWWRVRAFTQHWRSPIAWTPTRLFSPRPRAEGCRQWL
jgi:hypothetical protein